MKFIDRFFIAVITGLLGSGILFLVNTQPRGTAITLQPAPTAAQLVVQVSGAVKNPDVYELARGSRVADLIDLAGGFLENAYQENINLAQALQDGQKINVSFLAEGSSNSSIQLQVTQAPPEVNIQFPININTANQSELEALPVIGPAKAQDIISYRETHGPFTSIEQIQNVYGIGPSTFEQIKDLIVVQN